MKKMKRLGAAVLSLSLLLNLFALPVAAQEPAQRAEPESGLVQGLEDSYAGPTPESADAEEGLKEETDMPSGELSESEPGVEELSGGTAPLPEGEIPDDGPEGEKPSEGEEPDGGQDVPDVPLFPLKTEEHVVYIGGSGDRFFPEDYLKRSEAAKMIYFLLQAPADPGENQFPDVPGNSWYEPYVNSLARMSILVGDNGQFRPDSNITRAEFATILTRLFPAKVGEQHFNDVPAEFWAADAIAMAASKGWVRGYADGGFHPNDNIKRGEAVTLLNRVLGRTPDEQAIDEAGKILQFIDLSYSYWAYYQVMEASVLHSHEKTEGAERWLNFQYPTAEHAPGYHTIDGELYCVNDSRCFVRNETRGVLIFDSMGRYTTGSSQLDASLTAIVRAQTDPTLDRTANLYRLHQYTMNNYTYLTQPFLPEGTEGWEPEWALRMLTMGRGSCYSYAALETMLARKLGYQAVGTSGSITVDVLWPEQWIRHGWVEIVENGRRFVSDPEFEGVYCRNRGIVWDLFLDPYGGSPIRYRVNGVPKQ